MNKRLVGSIAIAACALGLVPSVAWTGDASPPATTQSSVPGWDEFVESLHTLPERMLRKLPESMQQDPQVQQEVVRLALASLASGTIDAIGGDADYPAFLPTIGQVLNVGQPNSDTLYRSARIDPDGVYRLRGKPGSLRMSVIGQVVPRSAESGSGRTHLDLSTLAVDSKGNFDVMVSRTRPDGYSGDWWELRPAATRLMLRMVSSDWQGELAPTISIERVDRPMGRPRQTAASLEQRLRALPVGVDFMGLMFVDHVEQLRRQSYINKFKSFDMTSAGGLAGQFYYEGAYELEDDEALVVAVRPPETCEYRSLILTNELYETTDWYNNHSSLNDAQAEVDSDGVLRIVVSARDPGVKNWLDTAGYPKGAIQGRWTNCSSQPIPTIDRVALAGLPKLLPPDTARVTPGERDAIIRSRRAALQFRPHW